MKKIETISILDVEYYITYEKHYYYEDESFAYMDFNVWEIVAYENLIPLFESKKNEDDTVKDIHEAQLYLKGRLKFDGCSDLYFREYYHSCSKEDVLAMGQLLEYLMGL